MAVCGIGLRAGPGSFQVQLFGGNSSTRLVRPTCDSQRKSLNLSRRRSGKVYFSSSGESVTPLEYEENDSVPGPSLTDKDLGHVMKFKMSDFTICKTVSVGLGGRSDEVVFEAMVNNSHSPLYNTRVVLRELVTPQAQRRGQRSLKVLKKLARRRLLYHSYSMQVHGYISMPNDLGSFTLVHGYHGSFSLRHWLQLSDWLPTLEATLALDEESVRKVGDDTVGGPAISRQLRLIRILMRDLLIGVNYLHSHGLAHTELRLENVHVSPVDGHIKVGILGNASDFYGDSKNNGLLDMERRQMMIAFDMRCVGFMLAKMVLRELMGQPIFAKFKSFLKKGNDPSCLREYLMQILNTNSASGNAGLQILDRNWGAGWNLLSLLLSNSPSKRISCLEALRHPFLCGPRWRVEPSMEIIRWGLGSTALRITEEYIYRQPQRRRVAHLIELMEKLNPHSRPRDWLELLPGRWRLLYSTGRHIGLTIRQPSARALIGNVHLTITRESKMSPTLSLSSNVGFTVMLGWDWPHNKAGTDGKLQVNSSLRLMAGRRLYVIDETVSSNSPPMPSRTQDSVTPQITNKRWKKTVPFVEFPSSLPVAKLLSSEVEVLMSLGEPLSHDVNNARKVIQEVRTQIPPEMFDVSKLVCGTYIDARLLVVRGVNGSALLFTRSCENP